MRQEDAEAMSLDEVGEQNCCVKCGRECGNATGLAVSNDDGFSTRTDGLNVHEDPRCIECEPPLRNLRLDGVGGYSRMGDA